MHNTEVANEWPLNTQAADSVLTIGFVLITVGSMKKPITPFHDAKVEKAFNAYPDATRQGLLTLRELVFETAAKTEGVGALEETLKWGQPAYLTPETKSGSTLRLGLSKRGDFAIFTHCQTTLMSDLQSLFPDDFRYEGNRAVHFDNGVPLPMAQIEHLIVRALTYHLK